MINLTSSSQPKFIKLQIVVSVFWVVGSLLLGSSRLHAQPDKFQQKYKEARNLYHNGNYRESQSVFESLLKQSPPSDLKRRIHYFLGLILTQQGKQPVQALDYFWNVYTRTPSDNLTDDSLFYMGKILRKQLDQENMALPYFKTVSEHFPDSDFESKAAKKLNAYQEEAIEKKKSFDPENVPKPKIVLNFKEVPLKNFISTYSELTGTNFLYGTRVEGSVTLIGQEGIPIDNLYGVLLNVLQSRGYTVTKKGDIHHIEQVQQALEGGVNTKLGNGGLESQFFTIKKLPWDEVINALNVILPRNKNLVRMKKLNRILVTTRPEKLKQITQLLSNMRSMNEQQKVKSTILEYAPSYVSLSNLSNKLQSYLDNYMDKNQYKIIQNQSNNTLLITIPSDKRKKTKNFIDRIDRDVDKKMVDQMKVRIFRLKNAQVNDVKQKITELLKVLPGDFLSENIKLVADQRQKAIIVSTTSKTALSIIEDTITELDQKSVSTPDNIRVFRLNHAEEEQVANSLREMKQVLPGEYPGGKIKIIPHERRRAIIVAADSKKVFSIVQKVINQIDKKDIQQPMTQHVYTLQNSQAGPLAEKLGSLFESQKQSQSERPLDVTADEQSNSLIVSASPQQWNIVSRMLDRLDNPNKQIMVDVFIVEASSDKVRELGVEWDAVGSVSIDGTSRDIEAGPEFNLRNSRVSNQQGGAGSANANPNNLFGLEVGMFEPGGNNLQALLHAFNEKNNFNLLSSAHLMANENEEASLSVGQKVPLLEESQTSEEGTSINQSFTFEDVGVQLDLVPTLSGDSSVTLDIEQQVEQVTDPGPQVGAPTRSNRNIQTTVSVPNELTLVLGGVLRSRKETSDQSVPYLGEIPYVEYLFQNQTESGQENNLLLFLRPHILSESSDLKQITDELQQKKNQRSSDDSEQNFELQRNQSKNNPKKIEPDLR